jgi:hypothetical protein
MVRVVNQVRALLAGRTLEWRGEPTKKVPRLSFLTKLYDAGSDGQ